MLAANASCCQGTIEVGIDLDVLFPEPRSTLLEASNEGQAEPCQQVQPTGLGCGPADPMQVASTSPPLHTYPQH